MSRRHAAEKREVLPDPRYKDVVVARILNVLMVDGKKTAAEKILYGAIEKAAKLEKKEPRQVLYEALDKCKPAIEVRSRRVGGATYPVPTELRPERAEALSFRWLIDSARKRSEKTMEDRLAAEIRDASQGRGAAVKKRDDTHRMAEANRAFSHYRW